MTEKYSWNQRGGLFLILDQYIYTKDKKYDSKTIWRCGKRSCKGSVTIDFLESIIGLKEHNHPIMSEELKKIKFMNELREKSKKIGSARKIITNSSTKFSDIEF